MLEKIIHIGLPKELHKDFKIACAKNSQSIKDALIELIKYYIDNPKMTLKDEKQN